MAEPLPYRDFYYPLNVFMHILTMEEGEVHHLHYGLFERGNESIAAAQERSTALLLTQLPPPPARILDVGPGLGTTLARLVQLGYDAEGITPDADQIGMLRQRHGDALRVHSTRFEDFHGAAAYDAIVSQESSQYIDSEAFFARAHALGERMAVLDEFALQPVGGLHRLDDFLAAAERHRFRVAYERDVSREAAPTIDYFLRRLPRFRSTLIAELGVTDQQVDDLIASGERYRELYRSGAYGYRLLRLERTDSG